MKKLLEKYRQFNKKSGRRGFSLVTVICVTSVALILILALSSLTYYALHKSIDEVTTQTATYNAESIAKMISDDLTRGGTSKSKYKPILEILDKSAAGVEITYNLNNAKLGNTEVVFKREENRAKNVIMRVTTDLNGKKGYVKVRFLLKQEGDNTGAILQEVEKIFDNTVYSGNFPTSSLGALHGVDFAGDLVIKADDLVNFGSSGEGAGIEFGGYDNNSFRDHNGNLIVIFGCPGIGAKYKDPVTGLMVNRPSLNINHHMRIHGNVITDGSITMDTTTTVDGTVLAKGNVKLGNSGAFGSEGTANIKDGISVISGASIDVQWDTNKTANGSFYARDTIKISNQLKAKGELYLGSTKDVIFTDWSIMLKKPTDANLVQVLGSDLKCTNTTTGASKTPYLHFLHSFGEEVTATRTMDMIWEDKIDSLIETVYSSKPVPMWYAPDDTTRVRKDTDSGSPEETWHNFGGADSNGVTYKSKMEAKYPGLAARLANPVTIDNYDLSSTTYRWQTTGDTVGRKSFKVINSSGTIGNAEIAPDSVASAVNPIATTNSGGDILSTCQRTVVFDTTGGNLHIKLRENIMFDDTDVVILGSGYVYFYTEQFRIDVGSAFKDNKELSTAKSALIDRYINFGVCVDIANSTNRKYNATYSGSTNTLTTNDLYSPHMFITSSYGETESASGASSVKHIAKGNVVGTINPFLCINNNANVYAYLYAPYRPVVISEHYWQSTTSNTLVKGSAIGTKDHAYKFMGSLCVARIDDYRYPTEGRTQGEDYTFGINLFRKGKSDPEYKNMYYFDPSKADGAFDGIVFNRECLAEDTESKPEEDNTPANPLTDTWSIEAFL